MTDQKMKTELEYLPETGEIFRRAGPWIPKRRLTLNTKNPNGCLYGTFNRKTYTAHRVAWFLYHGHWPVGEIDHIDGDPTNNKIENLRDVSHAENTRNTKKRKDNISGVVGVSYHQKIKRWIVRIGKKYVGCFTTFDEACAAREKAEIEHGYHKNHGR